MCERRAPLPAIVDSFQATDVHNDGVTKHLTSLLDPEIGMLDQAIVHTLNKLILEDHLLHEPVV